MSFFKNKHNTPEEDSNGITGAAILLVLPVAINIFVSLATDKVKADFENLAQRLFGENGITFCEYILYIASLVSVFWGLFELIRIFKKYDTKNIKVFQNIDTITDYYNKISETINGDYKKVCEKINSIALFKKYDEEDLTISVSNLDDYFLLMPLHYAKQVSQGMRLTIQTKPCGSDYDAISSLVNDSDKDCMFAIADPSFLNKKEFVSSDLVLLSCIIKKVPLWLLKNNYVDRSKPKKTILTITSDHNVYTGKVVSRNFNGCEVMTTTSLGDRIEALYKCDDFYEQSCLKEIIDNWTTGQFSKFSILLFSFLEDWSPDTIKEITDLFSSFDYILLTDPEISFIKQNILTTGFEWSNDNENGKTLNKTNRSKGHKPYQYASIEKEESDEENIVFTALIANKKKLRENSVLSLRFLRSLRIGLLKTNIALTTKESQENVMSAFIEYITKPTDNYLENKIRETYKKAFNITDSSNDDVDINFSLRLNESYFPNDLIISTQETKGKMFAKYEHFLFHSSEIKSSKDENEIDGLKLLFREMPC